MSPTIIIKHQGKSSLAGQEGQFSKETIRLGRRADNDVVFDAQKDLLVSGHHAELSVDGETLVLKDLGSTNGTFVNGKRVSGTVPLGSSDRVMFGEDGPEFVASIQGAAPAPTHAAGADPGPQATIAAAQARRVPQGGAPPKRAIGMNTMMGALDKVSRKERKRTVVMVASVLLVSAIAIFYVFQRARAAEAKAVDFVAVIEEHGPSICLVLTQSNAGGKTVESGVGTAWSVRDGVLATNAHVAEAFEEIGPNEVLIARTNSDPPIDLRIVGIDIHPGYRSYDQMGDEYQPFDHATGFVSLPPACDVALMQIHDEDKAGQPRPLDLASSEVLERLGGGTPLAYVGFPMEGTVGTDLQRPIAHNTTGALSRATDIFFGRPDSAETAYVLAYNLDVAGGASGSPVLDIDGEVVGLVSAIDVAGMSAWGTRIPGNVSSYGPRVDLLKELLQGNAEEKQEVRDEEWRSKFLEAFKEGVTRPEVLGSALARSALVNLASQEGVAMKNVALLSQTTGTISAAGRDSAHEFQVSFPEKGLYAVVAIALDAPHPLAMYQGTNTYDPDDSGYFYTLSYTIDKRIEAPFGVFVKGNGNEATRVACLVFGGVLE